MSSTLNDLRQFRLQKAKIPSENSPKIASGRKRIQLMSDSESEDENTKHLKKTKVELTVMEKEKRFLSAIKIAPEYCSMDVQDSLVRCNWDVSQGIRYLKEHFPKKTKPNINYGSTSNSNGSNSVPKKIHKKKRPSYNDDEDDDNDHGRPSDRVYDSDSDSGTEITTAITTTRKSVFDFLNNADSTELLTIKALSDKKVNVLIELRPFQDWNDLKYKLENTKSLSGDILNNCQDLLEKQSNVSNLMSKCNKMVHNLESAIANGAGITEQPSIIGEGLTLADYQLIGLNWLAVMHKQKVNAILADEMGLGKTIQVIAFFAYLKERNLATGSHLIVVPSSTLDNWEHEIGKWCPSLIIEKYYGSQDERRAMRSRFANVGFQGFDILLTTYHMVSSTPEERKMFRICKLHYVVFDEAHMLKNMTTLRYQQLITINAESRILLTGTPLQNNLLELMSLLCFVMPSMFGRNTEDIKSLFRKKIGAKGQEEHLGKFAKNQVEHAKRIMKPFLLRRVKKDVLKNLPSKTEHVLTLSMTDRQKQYYKELYDYYSINGAISTNEVAGCAIMMEMRKLANHPLLMRHYFSDDDLREIAKRLASCSTYKQENIQYVFEDIAWQSDFQIYQLCEKHGLYDVTIPRDLILDSGKFHELDKLLPNLKANGHRVLIFSQFTMMLDIVEKYMSYRNYGYLRLDGQTVVTERQEMIDNFNTDPEIFCFLLSTKAGGMGINLTAADTCIIHDIDFNPYNDKQAEDRVHRMGQTKPVTIYRLISEGTIEEAMHMIGKEKLHLEQKLSTNDNGDGKQEHKCMVRLLTMVLGLDEKRAEVILDQSPKKNSKKPIDSLENF